MPAPQAKEENETGTRSGTLNGGMDAKEMAARSVEARRENARRRKDTAEENALTFRQRLGVSLSKLSQTDLDKRVKDAKPAELVRFADQAFGRPTDADPDAPKDRELADLTREQRATLRAMLTSGEAELEAELPQEQGGSEPA